MYQVLWIRQSKYIQSHYWNPNSEKRYSKSQKGFKNKFLKLDEIYQPIVSNVLLLYVKLWIAVEWNTFEKFNCSTKSSENKYVPLCVPCSILFKFPTESYRLVFFILIHSAVVLHLQRFGEGLESELFRIEERNFNNRNRMEWNGMYLPAAGCKRIKNN